MSRRFRLLWLLLIALALPLQGAAAATMLPVLASKTTTGMAHTHHGEHCPHAGGQTGKAGTSACAVCCIGAALAACAPTVPPPRFFFTVRIRPNDRASPGLTPAVLERPPRPFLA